MYELNLLPEVDSFTFDASRTEEINREFIYQQFNMTFIDAQHMDFTDLLLQKSKEAGLAKPLNQSFAHSISQELENIQVKTVDSEKLEELVALEKELELINDKINRS